MSALSKDMQELAKQVQRNAILVQELTDRHTLYVARVNRAVKVIGEYGMIDGGHHKQWLLNEALQILILAVRVQVLYPQSG